MDVREFNRGNQERAGVGAEELMVSRADDHSELAHLEGSCDRVRWQDDRTPLSVLFVGGDGGFVGKLHLALHSRCILGKRGCGGVRNSGSHCRRRRGSEHEDIWGAPDTPCVSSVYCELDFAKDSAVC